MCAPPVGPFDNVNSAGAVVAGTSVTPPVEDTAPVIVTVTVPADGPETIDPKFRSVFLVSEIWAEAREDPTTHAIAASRRTDRSRVMGNAP